MYFSFIEKQDNINQLIITVPSENYRQFLSNDFIEKYYKDKSNDFIIKSVSNELSIDYENNINDNIINFLPYTDLFIGISFSQYNLLSNSNKLVDLTEYFESTELKDEDLFNPIKKALYRNNKIYAIPSGFYNYALIYNKRIFEKLDIPTPSNRMSWNEVMLLAEQIHDRNPSLYGIALDFDNTNLSSTINKLSIPIEGNLYIKEEGIVSFNKEKSQDLLRFYSNGIHSGIIAPSITEFFREKCAMGFIGLYDMDIYNNGSDPTFVDNISYEIVEAPRFSDNMNSYVLPGDMLGISIYSKKKSKSWEFIDTFIKNYSQIYDPGSFGWFPVYMSDPRQSVLNSHYTFDFSIFYSNESVAKQNVPYYNFEEFSSNNRRVNPILYQYIYHQINEDEMWERLREVLNS